MVIQLSTVTTTDVQQVVLKDSLLLSSTLSFSMVLLLEVQGIGIHISRSHFFGMV